MTDPNFMFKKILHPSQQPPSTLTYTPPGAKPGQKPVTVSHPRSNRTKKKAPQKPSKRSPQKSSGEILQERLMPKANVQETNLTEQQYQNETKETTPYSKYGKYDVIKKTSTVLPSISGLPQKSLTSYEFSYSPISKHKIEVAGSIKNYDEYLDIVRKNSIGLMAAYSIHGGKGIGPFGLIPSMGWDVALQSNKPTVTGASKREETLIKFLHSVKGSPNAKPSLFGELKYIATDVPTQFAATEAVFTFAPFIFRAGARYAGKTIGRISSRMPQAKYLFTKTLKIPTKLGGTSKQTVLETNIYRNFSKWLHGARPAAETTYKASFGPISQKLGSNKKTWRGIFHNIEHRWDIDIYHQTLKFKAVRKYGFAKREFLPSEIIQKESELLKQGMQRNFSVMIRGESQGYPWKQINITASKNLYRTNPFLRTVKFRYSSLSFESRTSLYPAYRPPAPKIGGIGPEFTKMTELNDFLSIAKKNIISPKMKNIWATNKWNPIKNILENKEAYTTMVGRPTSTSIEEQIAPKVLRHMGEMSGKGISKELPSVIVIPIKRGIISTTVPTALFFRSYFSNYKSKQRFTLSPSEKSIRKTVYLFSRSASESIESQISKQIQRVAGISEQKSKIPPPSPPSEPKSGFPKGTPTLIPTRQYSSTSKPLYYFYKKEMYGRGRKWYAFSFYGKKYKYREKGIFNPFKNLNLKMGKMVI